MLIPCELFFFLRKYLCSMKFFPSVHGDPIAQCTLKQILTWEPLLFAYLQSKVSSCKPLRILIILHWNWSWLHLLSHAILCIFTWKCTGNISQSLGNVQVILANHFLPEQLYISPKNSCHWKHAHIPATHRLGTGQGFLACRQRHEYEPAQKIRRVALDGYAWSCSIS